MDPREPEFYARPVLDVAADLLGCVIEHDGLSGRIVEAEAYHEIEPACHAFRGETPANRVLFGPPGHAYVYRSYGIHALLNAVCEESGVGAAVLIRALEPIEGIERMRARRGGLADEQLCSGPGKLTQALGIGLELNGTPLGDPVQVLPRAGYEPVAVLGSRIGITKAVELQWRVCDARSRHVSRPLPGGMRRPPARAAA